jgi:hypothetical protein
MASKLAGLAAALATSAQEYCGVMTGQPPWTAKLTLRAWAAT